MSTYWSEIPTDLLYSILCMLSIPDLFRCAAVCSHWSAVVNKVRRRPGDQRPQIPWLVAKNQFLVNGEYNDRNTYNFFSLSEGRVYDIPSRAPCIFRNVVGSSHGWLITVSVLGAQFLNPFEVSVQLLNPITGVQIDLPSVPTLDDMNLITGKAVLSADPSRGGDYSVVFVFYCISWRKHFLFFVSAGDREWTMISESVYCYDDVAFHKGKLYSMSRSEEVDEILVTAYDLIKLDSSPAVALPYIIWSSNMGVRFFFTSSDDLLIVRPTMKEDYCTVRKIEIWKVDTEKGVIVPINNLGKYALFLGSTSSLSQYFFIA